MKILKNKKIKTILTLFTLLCLYIMISSFSYANTISNNISENVLRLHVIANSDSPEDQNLKYLVRDELINYMNKLTSNIDSKEYAINLVKTNKENFKQIAREVILKNGFDYNVNIEINNFSFPTKNYGEISFPAGFYDAIKITIGSGQGQNWWCVMFPPLCFVDTSSAIVDKSSQEYLNNNLSEEAFAIINQNNSSDVTFKFKLIELFENVKIKLAQQ